MDNRIMIDIFVGILFALILIGILGETVKSIIQSWRS